MLPCSRVLDKQSDGDTRHAPTTKDVLPLLCFALTKHVLTNITAKVDHVNVAELFSQTSSQSIQGGLVREARTGNKANHAAVADAATGPSNGADVRVVETLQQYSIRLGGVRVSDPAI